MTLDDGDLAAVRRPGEPFEIRDISGHLAPVAAIWREEIELVGLRTVLLTDGRDPAPVRRPGGLLMMPDGPMRRMPDPSTFSTQIWSLPMSCPFDGQSTASCVLSGDQLSIRKLNFAGVGVRSRAFDLGVHE